MLTKNWKTKFKNKSGKSTFFQKKQTCLSKNHFMYKINLPTGQAPKGDIFYVMIIQVAKNSK